MNFKDEHHDGGQATTAMGLSQSNSHEKLHNKQINISQEIHRLIPVRGPTLFEKQLNEFVHGVASKSGMKKNPMMKGLTKKLSAHIHEEVSELNNNSAL